MNPKFYISPEQAERLKALGLNQDKSEAVWAKTGKGLELIARPIGTYKFFAAFNVGELGAIIPWAYQLPYAADGKYDDNNPRYISGLPTVWYDFAENFKAYPTEAQARAGLIIGLAEEMPFIIDHVNENIKAL